MNLKQIPIPQLAALILAIFLSADAVSAQSPKEGSRLMKGRAYTGLTMGVSTKNTNNQDILGLTTIVTQQNNSGQFELNGGYFIKDHFSVGGSYRYGESNSNTIFESPDQVRTTAESLSISHAAGIYMKYFTPLNGKETINLFARLGLSYQDERTLTESVTLDVLTRTFQKKNAVNLGFIPGVQVIVARGFAVETDISIAGLQSSWTKTYVNGEPDSDVSSTKISFDIDILSLNIGFFYYF